jgi:L-aspartate oxidase
MVTDKNIYKTDFLVIGSGVAGLTFALKTATHFKDSIITIVTKSEKNESNTKYAQGGIATVWNKTIDTFNQHIKDTLIAGDGICDEEIVKMVIKEAPDRLQELIDWGTNFDKKEDGKYALGREGGHSQNRILHHKDITGAEIERALLAQIKKTQNIVFLDYHFAIDLITEHQITKKINHPERKNNLLWCLYFR